MEIPETEVAPANIQTQGEPAAKWWVIRQLKHADDEADREHQIPRLYGNILASIGLSLEEVFTIDVTMRPNQEAKRQLNADLENVLIRPYSWHSSHSG